MLCQYFCFILLKVVVHDMLLDIFKPLEWCVLNANRLAHEKRVAISYAGLLIKKKKCLQVLLLWWRPWPTILKALSWAKNLDVLGWKMVYIGNRYTTFKVSGYMMEGVSCYNMEGNQMGWLGIMPWPPFTYRGCWDLYGAILRFSLFNSIVMEG